MLGLRKGTVEVVGYQSAWPALFARERFRLHKHIDHLVMNIQHIGSMAVPGLAAKSILDLGEAIAVPAVIDACKQPLAALGYIDRGDAGNAGAYLFVNEHELLERTRPPRARLPCAPVPAATSTTAVIVRSGSATPPALLLTQLSTPAMLADGEGRL